MRYLFLLTYICLTLISYSEKIIVLNKDNQKGISIPHYVYLLEDPKGILSLEQVILKDDNTFTLNQQSSLNLGFTKSIYWIKFSVINKTQSIQNLVFSIQYPFLTSVDFFSIKGLEIEKHIVTGNKLPFNTREINNRNFLFDLVLEPDIQYDYYVRVSSNGGSLQLPMSIDPYQDYLDLDNKRLLINGQFIGILLFVIIFNLFLLIISKRILNAYYTIYVFFLGLFLLNISGLDYQYLWGNNVWFHNHSSLLFSGLANVFLILFAKQFFNFKRNFYRINKMIKWLIGLILTVITLSLFNAEVFALEEILVNFGLLVSIFVLLLISIRGLIKNHKMHYYFVPAFVFLLLGVGIYVFNNWGIFNDFHTARLSLGLGFLVEVILLMFAVIHKYRNIEALNNKKLEEKVYSRTKELERQKEELLFTKKQIISQRDKIMQQHITTLKQSDVIANKNKEINDSIAYAKIIQNAVLPPKTKLDKSLKNYFILNMPKDILGGDFFWHYEKNGRIYVVVADCTGHGVPGAMISMLGIALLNEIILNKELLSPAKILDQLSKIVKRSLHQNGTIGEAKDSMDINICMIDKVTKTMLSAGSNNPVYIYRNQDIIEEANYINNYRFEKNILMAVLPDKLSIGYNEKPNMFFRDKKISLKENDMIYLFSDGYIDQFGGDKGKKLKRNRFRKLLSENAEIKNGALQYQHITSHLQEWKQQNEQVDDILVLGFRV